MIEFPIQKLLSEDVCCEYLPDVDGHGPTWGTEGSSSIFHHTSSSRAVEGA
jgi:hypothetical protein